MGCGQIHAQSAVAAIDLDVLAARTLLDKAGLPMHDAVATGVHRGHRLCQPVDARGDPGVERVVRQVPGREQLIRRRRARLPAMRHIERAAEGDHPVDLLRQQLGRLAGQQATETPADDADGPIRTCREIGDTALDPGHDAPGRSDVDPERPAVRLVARVAEHTAQRAGGTIVGEQSRQHQDVPAVAASRVLKREKPTSRGETDILGHRPMRFGDIAQPMRRGCVGTRVLNGHRVLLVGSRGGHSAEGLSAPSLLARSITARVKSR